MIKALTIAAVIGMATWVTPAQAEFFPARVAAYCTSSFSDIEKKFGEFESVDFGKVNDAGVAMVYMENEDWVIHAMAMPDKNVCIIWTLELDEAA